MSVIVPTVVASLLCRMILQNDNHSLLHGSKSQLTSTDIRINEWAAHMCGIPNKGG